MGLHEAPDEERRVQIQRLEEADGPVDLAALTATVERAMRALPIDPRSTFALVLAGDATLHDLNRRYRGIDGPTDVLSFRAEEGLERPDEAGDGPYLGDVIISVAYAGRSAAATSRDRDAELALLAVHGLLHLIGHDDADEVGAETMHAIERELGVRE